MWGLGITAIEMAETQPPRFNIHPMRVIFMARTAPVPSVLSVWPVTSLQGFHSATPKSHTRRAASPPQISKEPSPKLADADRWTMSMHDFVAEALVKDAKQRRTAAELLLHPFIASCKARAPACYRRRRALSPGCISNADGCAFACAVARRWGRRALQGRFRRRSIG